LVPQLKAIKKIDSIKGKQKGNQGGQIPRRTTAVKDLSGKEA